MNNLNTQNRIAKTISSIISNMGWMLSVVLFSYVGA